MSALSDKLSGKAKQTIGGATGNDRVRNEGKLEETKGKLKDKLKGAGDVASKKIDEIKNKDSNKR